MFDLDHWREIYAALSANKVRTALTAFGVFWGILMLMFMLGSGNGLENGVKQDFEDNATNKRSNQAQGLQSLGFTVVCTVLNRARRSTVAAGRPRRTDRRRASPGRA